MAVGAWHLPHWNPYNLCAVMLQQWANSQLWTQGASASLGLRVQTASDDLVFYSYQAWASAKDFFKHVKSDAVKPLGKLIIEEVCVWELIMSFKPHEHAYTLSQR